MANEQFADTGVYDENGQIRPGVEVDAKGVPVNPNVAPEFKTIGDWTKWAKAHPSNPINTRPEDRAATQDIIDHPDNYYLLSGHPVKKTFYNQHPVLATALVLGGMAAPGAITALSGAGGGGAGAGAAGAATTGAETTIPTTFGIDAATAAALPGASAGPGAALAGLAGTGAGTSAATGVTSAATTAAAPEASLAGVAPTTAAALPSTTIGTGAVPAISGTTGTSLAGVAPEATTVLPSTTIGTGMMPAISGTTGATTSLGVPAAASTGSRLADLYDVGKGLSSYAQTSAKNRAAEAEIGQGGPAADAAAMKNLLHLNYLAGGGTPRFAGQNTPSGHIVPIGYQNPAVTGQQQSDAAMMRDTLIKKLQAGQAPTFSGVQPAGTGENLAGTGALIASVAPSILHYFG